MALRKFADATILGAEIAPPNGRMPEMWKASHRVTFDYAPRPGYLYVRSRMISSRCNDNFDEFPAGEIIGDGYKYASSPMQILPHDVSTGYLTFLGKPVFVNHHNANHRRSRGVITQVALHEDRNPDGSPDTWAEGLMEVDAVKFPKLAEALIKKWIERTSMGVDVAFSICAACDNKATTPAEYCQHIPGQKGRQFVGFTREGSRKKTLIRETCHGLRFFENSLLVEDPADPTAFTLGDVELGPGLDHLRTASRLDTSRLGWVEPHQVQPARENGNWPGVDMVGSEISSAQPVRGHVTVHATRTTQEAPALQLFAGRKCIDCSSLQTVANRAGDTECLDCGLEFHATAIAKDAAGPKFPNPADHPWFRQNPVHHDNIVDHWSQATPDEKASGKNWYADAHIIATALGEHHEKIHGPTPHGPAHLGAGIVAAYSPQMGWAGNMHNAARVLHEGKGLGGKGSGMFASEQQRKTADRLLSGERHEDALGGPKIQDFAHLIEHGGDKDPQSPRAVIDRHALSVATGKRMSDDDYSKFPKSQRHYYGHAVSQYHEAAKRITEAEGEHVAAHQVQAVTWLVRQRKNQEAERASAAAGNDSRLDKGREVGRQRQERGWQDWRETHTPDLPHAGPGTGYQAKRGDLPKGRPADWRRGTSRVAYGETKAPADVDTLRDASCPVCGEPDAWDGDTCPVCGFVQPPQMFQDPDLDKARQVDLRKNDGDLNGTDVSDLEAQTNDRDRDGLDDVTGEPINAEEQEGDFDEQPELVCPACETPFEAAEPQTINTRDPEAGSDSLGGPEAGDICPACGKAELMTGTELQELMGAEEPTAGPTGAEPVPEEEDQEPEDMPFGRPDSSEEDEDENPDEDPEESDEDDEDSGKPVKQKGSPFKR
jgi:hypothetical protein